MAWVPLGPACIPNGQLGYDSTGRGPVGGRVTCIALSPTDPDNTIFIGTANGGVWRSSDVGKTWTPLMDDKVSMSIGAMQFHPTQPNLLYVATGEGNRGGETFFGNGLMIHDTVADTWSLRIQAPLQKMRCSQMALQTTGASTRILLATGGGILESIDDGLNWNVLPVTGAAPSIGVMSALQLVPAQGAQPERLLVGVRWNGIYARTGAGAFAPVPKDVPGGLPSANVDNVAIAVAPNTPSIVYAALGNSSAGLVGIFRSTDSGATWQPVTPPSADVKQTFYNFVLAIDPTNPATIYFCETRIWKSTNSGVNWEKINEPRNGTPGIHADQHALVVHPTKAQRVWAGNDGGVWYSENGGDTWTHRNRGLQINQYYSLANSPTDTVLLVGAQDNGTQRFEGQPAWNLVGFGDGFFCAIDQADPRYWYRSYVFQPDAAQNELDAIFRSDKAGDVDSFSRIVSGIGANDTTDRDPFYVPFIIDPSQTNVLYLGTSKLYRTDNRGDRWAAVKKTDGTDFTTGNLRANAISAIAVNPKDSNEVYVGTSDGRLFHLVRQGNGQYQVNPRPGPFGGELVGDIAVPKTPGANPPSQSVYVGIGSPRDASQPPPSIAAGRIFFSNNQGAAWQNRGSAQLNQTLQGFLLDHRENPVNAIATDPANPGHVYIGCQPGVFRSVDEGANWTPFNDGLPNTAVADLQFHEGRRLLRAATSGRGVWEIPVDAPPAAGTVTIHVRDSLVDAGRQPTPLTAPNPIKPGADVKAFDSVDLKVDTPFPIFGGFQTPKSTVDYTEGGAADFIAFQQFSDDSPRSTTTSRVYVQVQSRGPAPATDVSVRVFAAKKIDGNFAPLDNLFWTNVFDGNAGQFSMWKPIGDKQVLSQIPVALPSVVKWDWETPFDSGDTIGLLTVISAPGDPVAEASLDVEQVVRNNRHVALKEVTVGLPDAFFAVLGILLVVGLAVGVGAAIDAAT
jgi:Sortilin, neurotensin receptor 3,